MTDIPRTPAQQRVWSQLLGADDRRAQRPHTDPLLAERLRDRVAAAVRPSLAAVPPNLTIWLNKAALASLSCDGRYLDHLAVPFAWSPATVAGQLAHTAIEVDLAGGRQRSVEDVARHAWTQLMASGTSAGAFLAELDAVETDALHAETLRRCLSFRDCFPQLPPWMHPRAEVALTWRLSPQVIIKGIPDLVVGRPDSQHRFMQLIELKTGGRRTHHREGGALYALLATVKYGVAPFRVATYYLDEADWEADDVTPALLESAADTLASNVRRAIQLTVAPPEPSELELHRGPGCNWCTRAPTCPLTADRSPVDLMAA